jgi:hypothetical protein
LPSQVVDVASPIAESDVDSEEFSLTGLSYTASIDKYSSLTAKKLKLLGLRQSSRFFTDGQFVGIFTTLSASPVSRLAFAVVYLYSPVNNWHLVRTHVIDMRYSIFGIVCDICKEQINGNPLYYCPTCTYNSDNGYFIFL